MAVPVQFNKKGKAGVLGKAGTAVGAIVGGFTGGPGGALKGAQLGSSIGGGLGQMVDSGGKGTDRLSGLQSIAGGISGAMGGGKGGQQGAGIPAPQSSQITDDPDATLRDAQMQLQNEPPEIQQQYGPMLASARMRLRRGQMA